MKRKEKILGSPITVDVRNSKGDVVSTQVLPADIFSVPIKEELVHFAVTVQQANARKGTSAVKDRGDVRGGGKKPWKQKGTGRARHGSIRSPIWRGGGVVFGPTSDRNWSLKINKKVKLQALRMVLSDRAAQKRIVLIDTLNLDTPKTKEASALFARLQLRGTAKNPSRIGVIVPPHQPALRASMRNLLKTELLSPLSLNVVDLLRCNTLLVPLESLQEIVRILTPKA